MTLPLQEVTFNHETTCTGRNGYFRASGVEVYRDDRIPSEGSVVDLQPRTSRDKPANCHISFPVEDAAQIVQAIEKVTERSLSAPLFRVTRDKKDSILVKAKDAEHAAFIALDCYEWLNNGTLPTINKLAVYRHDYPQGPTGMVIEPVQDPQVFKVAELLAKREPQPA